MWAASVRKVINDHCSASVFELNGYWKSRESN